MIPKKSFSVSLVAIALLAAIPILWHEKKRAPAELLKPPLPGLRRKAAIAINCYPPAPWPWKLGLAEWVRIIKRTYFEIVEDQLMAVAGGVVFFVLLAIFPAIAAFVSLYALFTDPATIETHLLAASTVVPTDAFHLLQGEVHRIASKRSGSLGFASLFGLLFALWSANSGTKAMFEALNVAFDGKEKRSFIWLNIVSLGFTLGSLAFLLVAVAAVVVLPLVLGQLGLQNVSAVLFSVGRWPALFVVTSIALSFLYQFGPSHRQERWHWVTTGSMTATLLWLIASGLFSWYLGNFADYTATYGALGAAIGLMMWLWITFLVILVGAEIDKGIGQELTQTGPADQMDNTRQE